MQPDLFPIHLGGAARTVRALGRGPAPLGPAGGVAPAQSGPGGRGNARRRGLGPGTWDWGHGGENIIYIDIHIAIYIYIADYVNVYLNITTICQKGDWIL